MDPRADISYHRRRDTALTVVVALMMGAAVTVMEVAPPSLHGLTSRLDALVPAMPSVKPPAHQVTKTPVKPVPATTPAAAVAPKPAAVTPTAPALAVATATTNSFVHLRAGKSTSTAIIADLNAGTVVQLRDDSNATWQGVTYQGQDGYIYRSYLSY